MTPQEAHAHIKAVDTQVNKNIAVPDDKKRLSVTKLFDQQGWPAGSKLIGAACRALELEDCSEDNRWNHHFQNNRQHLGIYRSKIGFYWLLSCNGAEHALEQVGPALEVLARYKNK